MYRKRGYFFNYEKSPTHKTRLGKYAEGIRGATKDSQA